VVPTNDSARAWTVGLLVGLYLMLVLQVMCLGPARFVLWGLHVPVFLPLWAAVGGWFLVASLVPWALFGRSRHVEAIRLPGIPIWLVAILAGAVFWILRSQQDLLGDAFPLIHSLPTGVDTHPRQPLTMWIQQQFFQLLGPMFDGSGLTPPEIARRTVAVGSVLCGVGFVFVARALAREIAGILPEDRRSAPVGWIGLLLGLQGWTLLFYGYLENYSFVALALAAMLWSVLRALRTGASLVPAVLFFVLAVGLHLSTVALGLVLALAILLHWLRHRGGVAAVFSIVALVLGFFLLQLLLQSIEPGFAFLPAIERTLAVARQDQGGGAGLLYLTSIYHLNDWFNGQVLLGSVGVFLLMPLVVIGVVGKVWRGLAPGAAVLLAFAGFIAVGHFATAEPALGYARDWDLFAPTVTFVVAAAIFALLRLAPVTVHRRLMIALLVFSIWQTGSWIALNASEARSVERFAHLPLGLGRTEVVLGRYHREKGNREEAMRWYERALRRNPANNTAWSLVSRMHEENGDTDLAVAALERALASRPRKPEYHERLISILIGANRPDDAAAALSRWLEIDPSDPDRWFRLAGLWDLAGNPQQASAALARASRGYQTIWPERSEAVLGVRIGDCEAGLDRVESAGQWYARALEVEPGHAPAHARLAVLALASGDRAAAERHRRAASAGDLDARDREVLEQAFRMAPR
jgi:tetratricopeptide (TPR) repeat protein